MLLSRNTPTTNYCINDDAHLIFGLDLVWQKGRFLQMQVGLGPSRELLWCLRALLSFKNESKLRGCIRTLSSPIHQTDFFCVTEREDKKWAAQQLIIHCIKSIVRIVLQVHYYVHLKESKRVLHFLFVQLLYLQQRTTILCQLWQNLFLFAERRPVNI